MQIEKILPSEIEKRSMEIIASEIKNSPELSEDEMLILKRVIHTTADFEYCSNLKFSEGAVGIGKNALRKGAVIVTDTNMALSGINDSVCKKYNCKKVCFMSDSDVAEKAQKNGVTRASVSMEKAAEIYDGQNVIFAVGNAPTALIRLYELISTGKIMPSLVIGVPVGFVNVVQSKSLIMSCNVPYIVSEGRKGGSNVAAAICNALLYQL